MLSSFGAGSSHEVGGLSLLRNRPVRGRGQPYVAHVTTIGEKDHRFYLYVRYDGAYHDPQQPDEALWIGNETKKCSRFTDYAAACAAAARTMPEGPARTASVELDSVCVYWDPVRRPTSGSRRLLEPKGASLQITIKHTTEHDVENSKTGQATTVQKSKSKRFVYKNYKDLQDSIAALDSPACGADADFLAYVESTLTGVDVLMRSVRMPWLQFVPEIPFQQSFVCPTPPPAAAQAVAAPAAPQ